MDQEKRGLLHRFACRFIDKLPGVDLDIRCEQPKENGDSEEKEAEDSNKLITQSLQKRAPSKDLALAALITTAVGLAIILLYFIPFLGFLFVVGKAVELAGFVLFVLLARQVLESK